MKGPFTTLVEDPFLFYRKYEISNFSIYLISIINIYYLIRCWIQFYGVVKSTIMLLVIVNGVLLQVSIVFFDFIVIQQELPPNTPGNSANAVPFV